MQYFKNTHEQGLSKWWAWGFVFWLTFIGWILAQFFMTSPLLPIAQEISPELGQAFTDSSAAMFEEINMALIGLAALLFLISTPLGLIFSLVALNTKSAAKREFGIAGGVGVGLSCFSAVLLSPLASSPEGTEVLNRLLAQSPLSYALVLLVFPTTLVALYLGQKFILKRSILSLHTAFSKFRFGRTIQAVAVTWVILGSMAFILNALGITPLTYSFHGPRFFIYGAISLALIPLQSATEEIVFRGYLNQAVENLTRNKWIAFTLTSLLFMAMHLANPEALSGAEAGILPIVMSGYFFFGFAACLMVWMDDGLESAIGVHAANNTFAAVFVNYENSVLPTPSLFQIRANPVLDSVLTIVTLSLILIVLYALRPKPVVRAA